MKAEECSNRVYEVKLVTGKIQAQLLELLVHPVQ